MVRGRSMRPMRRFSVVTVAATIAVGLTSVGPASAAPTMSVTPATGLSAGTSIHVVVSGLSTVGLPNVKIAECANAAGDGTPLAAVVPATDCQIFADAAPSPTGDLAVDFAVLQTGIGNGNRSCLASLPSPCQIKIVESTNQPSLPSPVDLSFVGDPAPNALATTTELTPVGSPVGIDKTPHVRVEVSATPGFIPLGSVTILEGATSVGTAVLAGGAADIALDPLPLGSHSLVAQFTGDGSFAASTSSAETMDITQAANISVGDASVMEGPAGRFTSIAFPVVLSHPSPTPVTVDVDVASGSGPNAAQAGSIVGGVVTPGTDVLMRHQTLKFAANIATVSVFVAKVVDALTKSPNWSSSALFVTYDEHGGLFDHVPPPNACPPGDFTPVLQAGDPPGLFDRYGVRVPMMLVSPFAKKHFVAHDVYDHTSIVRFIEARFILPAITDRDANAEVPWEMFDFAGAPHATPPAVTLPDIQQAKIDACKPVWVP